MNSLYKKSELWFALALIAIYVVGSSVADTVSGVVGAEKSVTFIFHGIMSVVIFLWIRKNGLLKKYGLCRSKAEAKSFLYFIPLGLLSSANILFLGKLNMSVFESLLFSGSMLFVGFLEEIIFRGFLFRAMAEDNEKCAVVITSITFGLGHILNLFNSNNAGLSETLCQIAGAVAFGFLFVVIFQKSGSLVPCIVSHSFINILSVYTNHELLTPKVNGIFSLVLCVVTVIYSVLIYKFRED